MKLIFVAVLVLCCSCSQNPLRHAAAQIGSQEKPLPPAAEPAGDTLTDQMRYELAWIREYADIANDKYPPEEKAEKIVVGAVKVHDLTKAVDAAEQAQLKAIEELRNGDKATLKRIWLLVVAASALLVLGGAVVGWVISPKIGGGLALSGLTACVCSYLMLQYAWVVGLLGLSIFLLAVALVVRELLKSKTTIAELVKSFEHVKEASFQEVKQTVSLIQSPATQATVSKVKETLGLTQPAPTK